jgi:hypothetical protein
VFICSTFSDAFLTLTFTVVNSGMIIELYSQIARDMEGSGHDVIGAITHIFTWKKYVSNLRFSQMLLKMWRCEWLLRFRWIVVFVKG